MKDLNASWAAWMNWFNSDGREKPIKDYLVLANQLVWQRQASFFAAAVLAALYFDPISTFATYGVVVLTEMLDMILGRKSKAWDGQDPVVGRQILKSIVLNTTISAMAISVFIINIAVQQTSGGHFTPLFFLFSASLFAAMYNSQMIGILLLRLSIYGFAFLYIAFLDVVRYSPPLSSYIWLEFFTIIFVLYFIIDISVKFYFSYHNQLNQMKLIKEENERTKAALEIKSQFLSTVSHELRTPLTSIIGGLDLVNNGVLGEVPEYLKPIIGISAKNGHRLANLIDDLLDLQKIEAGEIAFHFKPLDANDVVNEAVESTTGYAEKLGIKVMTVPCVEDCRFMGDHGRLIQVMNNLLSNALKFSGQGGTVKVRVETSDAHIRILVQDEGVGIPKGAKDRVFGKFSQVDSSDVRKVGGTGLGLNITKQIVERHSGTIDYVSELGVGSTFCIEFDRLTDKIKRSSRPEMVADVARRNTFNQTMARSS
ncbi:MAG: HAMP domain-containing sensor histidine kinase [Pseudotabrizicola sp.]|uniref:sensor histidine kinase n=1 Tax=Pseudotabrizicola sp. TaxID=2939647 RepID=UPI002719486E|nr:HAMP domain-containing sensor histidine kinase [Pseudotabrizicola sp.]MDO8882432.1 HAMP domain-containing sensor histidine kinase [Pseudotabrizicola sp.]MDP2081528.1 HAMP domain-containing sensor histidine kinase [Pseudotabrizicola sp.]MDZ7575731.1 HAMP domain-containing sensor histidine kinase [Pseudotabrizicola sp.]